MNFKFTIFILFIVLVANSQETETYKRFANQVKPVETKTYTEEYKNGNIKKTKTLTTYNFNGENFVFYSGTYIEYSKKGNKKFERIHNMFGSPLTIKWYDKKGRIIAFSKTIDLDTNAKSTKEFLSSNHIISITSIEEKYIINQPKNKSILRKKGKYVNGFKSGVWEIYKNGEVEKIKKYKVLNKFENLSRDRNKK